MAARYIHLSGRSHVPHILSLEGLNTNESKPSLESPVRVKTCPRCAMNNEASAIYCNHCGLVMDEKLLITKERGERETDQWMNKIMEHPKVKEVVKEVLRELIAKGSFKELTKS